MASLNVRNLPEKVQRRLRLRAARAGRSMEAEAREILTAATLGTRRAVGATELQLFVDRLYGSRRPTSVVDDLIGDRRKEAQDE
jgi:plasmid stability protein